MTGKRPRILCLDDQRENLQFRKMFLEQFGCEVLTAEDAQECLRIASSERLDLAILDYHLAGEVTGEDVARDLQIMVPDVALMMLSGDPYIPESAKECVDAVFLKGSSGPGELIEIIRGLLPDCEIKARRKPISREALNESMRRTFK